MRSLAATFTANAHHARARSHAAPAAITFLAFLLHLDSGRSLFAVELVRTDVLEAMEFVQQDVLITLSTPSIESFVPVEYERQTLSRQSNSAYQEFPARFVNCRVKGIS